MKYAAILSVLIIVPALAFFSVERMQAPISRACDLHFSSGLVLYSIPLADNPARIRRGLSGGGRGDSMLFYWRNEDIRTFSMKNTPVNLSVGFFDKDGFLFQVADMEAGSSKRYGSNASAKYALELATGQFQAKGLELGSRLIRKECGLLQ